MSGNQPAMHVGDGQIRHRRHAARIVGRLGRPVGVTGRWRRRGTGRRRRGPRRSMVHQWGRWRTGRPHRGIPVRLVSECTYGDVGECRWSAQPAATAVTNGRVGGLGRAVGRWRCLWDWSAATWGDWSEESVGPAVVATLADRSDLPVGGLVGDHCRGLVGWRRRGLAHNRSVRVHAPGRSGDRMVGGDVGDCRRVGLVGGLVGPPGWRRWRTGGDRPVLDRRVSSAAATSGTGRTLNGPAGGDVGGLVGDVGDRDRSVAMSGDWSAATSGDRSEDWSVHPWVATLADWSDRSGTGGGPVGGDVGDWSAATSGGTGRRTGRSSRRRYDSRRAIRRDRWRVDRSAAMSGDRSAATLGTRSEDWSVQRRAAHAGTGQCGDR
jgi:hypothetical protein